MADVNEDTLHIRLSVYDTILSVNIPRADEEFYRKAAKLITDTINNYASVFKGKKSDKELLYMVLIDIALRYEKELTRNDTTPFSNVLKQLTSEIEDTLKV